MWVAGEPLEITCGAYNSPGPSILDSGTSSILLPRPVLTAFAARLSMFFDGRSPSSVIQEYLQGTCSIPATDALRYRSTFPNISLGFTADSIDSGQEFLITVPPSHYLVPCCKENALNEYDNEGSNSGALCNYQFLIGETSCAAPTALTVGLPMLGDLIVLFDRQNRQVGFAAAAGCTGGNSLVHEVMVGQKRPRLNASTDSCAPSGKKGCPTDDSSTGFSTTETILVIFCSIIVTMLLYFLIVTIRSTRRYEAMDRPSHAGYKRQING